MSDFVLPTPSINGKMFDQWTDGNDNKIAGGNRASDLTTYYNAEFTRTSVTNIISDMNNLFLYPNPVTNGVLNINTNEEDYEIQIMDLSGNIVYNKRVKEKNHMIDASHWNSGVYLVRINYNKAFKLIIN